MKLSGVSRMRKKMESFWRFLYKKASFRSPKNWQPRFFRDLWLSISDYFKQTEMPAGLNSDEKSGENPHFVYQKWRRKKYIKLGKISFKVIMLLYGVDSTARLPNLHDTWKHC